MKNENESRFIEYLDQRFDQLEKMVALSLTADLISDYMKNRELELKDDILEKIEKYGYSLIKVEPFGKKIAVYIVPSYNVGLKEIRGFKKKIEECYKNITLVFVLNKINSVQRNKMLEEKISFSIEDTEIYISN